MTPLAESESRIGFSCSGRCSEPLKSVREAREIDFGAAGTAFSVLRQGLPRCSLARFGAKAVKAVQAAKIDIPWASEISKKGRRPGGRGQGRAVLPPHGAAV